MGLTNRLGQYAPKERGGEMRKYLLLIALLTFLSGCAFGVYDSRTGFEGAVIGVPYPYYEPYYPDYPDGYPGGFYYGHGYRYYPYSSGRYYRVPAFHRHYR